MTILPGRILAYHRITAANDSPLCVRPEDFRSQMRTLLTIGLSPTSLADIARGRFVVTFDDGYADAYLEALPILDHYGVHATVFVCPAYVGRHQRDIDKGVHLSEPTPFLTWEQLAEMAEQGHVIGSHGMTHRDLPALADDELAEELSASRASLEERLGHRVVDFCYPRGRYDDRVVAAVAAAGYRRAVVTPARGSRIARGPFTQERVGLHREDVGWRFWAKVTRMRHLAGRLLPAAG